MLQNQNTQRTHYSRNPFRNYLWTPLKSTSKFYRERFIRYLLESHKIMIPGTVKNHTFSNSLAISVSKTKQIHRK